MAGARDAIAAAVAAQIEQAAAGQARARIHGEQIRQEAAAAEVERRNAAAAEESIAAMVAAEGAGTVPLQPVGTARTAMGVGALSGGASSNPSSSMCIMM